MPRNPQLSIYLIAGNEAKYIGRCLDAFSKYADELVVCIARGGLNDDGTEEIARSKGARIVHYKNDPANAAWPHVDHFGKARQAALEACSGQFAMWVDADDLPAHGLKERLKNAIKTLQEREKVGIYAGVYAVLNAKLNPIRERLVKRLPDRSWSGRWHYAVHEALLPIPGYEVVGEQNPWVEHHVDGYKPASADRNMRILESQLSEAGKYAYYLQQELFLSGKREQSSQWSHVSALWPTQEPTLRYESWCNYGSVQATSEQRMAAYAKAHQASPGRREALYYMAREEASAGRWGAAFHLLKAAMVQPDPGVSQWNAQRQIYDFECIDLYIAAARAVGDTAEAEKIEAQWRKTKPVKITVCHATRGRPQEAINARILWMKKAADPGSIEWIYATDDDDPKAGALKPWGPVSGKGGCVAAWNRAAEKARGEIIIQGSDDWDPPLWWDKIVSDRIGDTTKESVLAVSDGHRKDQLLCLAILTRNRYLRQGYLFAPEYDASSGIFSGNEFTARAYADGCVIEARDVVFQHNNPMFTGQKPDAEFLRQVDSMRVTQDWNQENRWYKHLPRQLLAQCLRVLGQHEQANQIVRDGFRGAWGRITVIHAGEPDDCLKSMALYTDCADASNGIQHLLLTQKGHKIADRLHIVQTAEEALQAALGDVILTVKAKDAPLPGLRWDATLLEQGTVPPGAEQIPSPVERKGHVKVCLTTTPKRIHTILPTLQSLLNQSRPADEICLSLPEKLARTGERMPDLTQLPDFLKKLVEEGRVSVHTVRDHGPATKFVGGAHHAEPDDFIIWCDDDILYSPRMVQTLVENCPDKSALALCGFFMIEPKGYAIVTDHLGHAEILEGFGAVCCRKKDLPDLSLWPSYTAKEFAKLDDKQRAEFLADDFMMSQRLREKGTATLVCNTPDFNRSNGILIRPEGLGEDALQNNKQTGGNLAAYALLKG